MGTDEQVFAACASGGDAQLWEEFVKRFQRLIATIALRVGRQCGDSSPATLEEIVQETFLRLCANNCAVMKAFTPRHENAVYGFIKVVAASVAHDHFRSRSASKRGGIELSSLPIDAPQVELQLAVDPQPMEQEVLLRQIHSKLETLLPGEGNRRDRIIFTLYFRHGMTANAIASIPEFGLSAKGVETVLFRTVRLLRQNLSIKRRVANAD